MSKRIWCSGPPPHIGWWNASTRQKENVWRWWNGKYWSYGAADTDDADAAAFFANIPTSCKYIEYTLYWPVGARVRRVHELRPQRS